MIQSKPFKKSSKKYSKSLSSKEKENESTFSMLQRERKEKEASAKLEQEKEMAIAKKEYEHKCKIVYNYMEKLDKKLKETIGDGFFVWIDDPKLTKFKISEDKIEKMAKNDPAKYADRSFAYFHFATYHDTHGKEKQLLIADDAWIKCSISICTLKKNGKIDRDGCRGANWIWRTDDFKITKFTYKFLYYVMQIIAADYYSFMQLGGVGLDNMINKMKKNGVKFPKGVLQPLAGV